MKSGFEKEFKDLIENKNFFVEEWKTTYKSMDPKEISIFLNEWSEELAALKSESSLDSLSKGIISNDLFNELVNIYPGNLISSALKEKLMDKMGEKIDPFRILQKNLLDLLEKGQQEDIKKEISNALKSYEEFIGNKQYLDQMLNDFLLNIINNYQEKVIDIKILKFVTESYLKFLKNKKGDLNQALLFIKLGSHFHENNETAITKECLLKSKQIYEELGHEKDQAKVVSILDNLKTSKKKK